MSRSPTIRYRHRRRMTPQILVASGFFTGFFPGIPGTIGSLLGLGLGALMTLAGPGAVLIGAAGFAAAGYWAIDPDDEGHDPKWVVIDEIAGQILALAPIRHFHWPAFLLAFVFFRFLDILKPPPIQQLDKIPNRIGILGDDILAGAATAIVLLLLDLRFPHLL